MQAGKLNLVINKKASFKEPLTLYTSYDAKTKTGVPVDLTGATIISKVKAKATDSTYLISFTCTITDATAGKFELSLTDSQTSSIAWDKGLYDVLVTDNTGFATRYLEGNVIVSKNIS